MTTVGRAGEVWFLSMVDWIEYEPFGAKKNEIKIVNKQAATVESLIDGHRVKNVISWTSWSLSLPFLWWSDQWRRVSYSLLRVRVLKFKCPHWKYEPFSLDNFDGSECRAEFRVDKEDIPLLVNALQVPEYFRCPQGTGKAVRGGWGSDPVKKVNIIFNNKQINK